MRKTRLLAVAGTTAALAFVGAPAQAAIIDKGIEQVDETYEAVCDRGTTDDTSDDLRIQVQETGTTAYLVRTRGPDGYAFGSFVGNIRGTYTNPDTGRSWSTTARWFERDSRVLEVSEDGEVITMLVRVVFTFNVFDEAGALDSFNRGLDVFTLHIDTNGTPLELDDDEVEFGELLREYGPRTADEFCVAAERFTVS